MPVFFPLQIEQAYKRKIFYYESIIISNSFLIEIGRILFTFLIHIRVVSMSCHFFPGGLSWN